MSKTKQAWEALDLLKNDIGQAVGFDNDTVWLTGPHSSNIVTLTLHIIGKQFGTEEANKVIDEYCLAELGWKKEGISSPKVIDIEWIIKSEVYATFADTCTTTKLFSHFNDQHILDELNNHRQENITMGTFNVMIAKAITVREL